METFQKASAPLHVQVCLSAETCVPVRAASSSRQGAGLGNERNGGGLQAGQKPVCTRARSPLLASRLHRKSPEPVPRPTSMSRQPSLSPAFSTCEPGLTHWTKIPVLFPPRMEMSAPRLFSWGDRLPVGPMLVSCTTSDLPRRNTSK